MEIHLHNPWLTYGIGLHRLREAGLLPEICGYLDQRPLTLDDLHEFCETFFIGDDGCIDLPHPMEQSWNNFFRTVKVLVEKEKRQWNPVKKKTMPWIDLDRLEAMYDAGKDGMNQRQNLEHHDTKHDRHKNPHSYTTGTPWTPLQRAEKPNLHLNTHHPTSKAHAVVRGCRCHIQTRRLSR